MTIIEHYFPELTAVQKNQFEALYDLYLDWNSKINVISRKDITNLYEHHVLHSLAIAKMLKFKAKSKILDVGTGGGFPGIPLAILFPEASFHLLDSVGKKVRVAQEVALAIGLKNCTFEHNRVQDVTSRYDFVVSRAVMPLSDLVVLIRKNIAQKSFNAWPNGLICLKGGALTSELAPFKKTVQLFELSQYFEEEFFKTKYGIFLPL